MPCERAQSWGADATPCYLPRVQRAVFVLLSLCLLSCSEDPPPEAPAAATAPAEGQSPTAAATPASADGEPAPLRTRYDLARHASRGELFHGEDRVFDLGSARGHQHTLGGWRTRAGESHDFDGVDATLITNVTGFFVIPFDGAGRCTLSLRARAFSDGRLTLYVDDQTVGNVRLPTDAFATVHATIPEALCTPGEHDLRVRVPATGSLPGVPRVGVAVDWMRVGAEASEVGPVEVERVVDDQPSLAIPEGWSVAYSFEVPAGGRLMATARGAVEVAVERDGEAAASLPTSGSSLDVDLSRFAGEIVRLRLSARGEDATLIAPRVVTRDATPLRPARRMRNVLVYLTDTLRADHLRVYEPETRVETPGLSSWARRAATFLSGHSQENWTKPSCATLLSGLFPWEHHATSEEAVVPESVELLGERLGDEGFHTGAFIANGFVSDRFGFRQGWSTYRNYIREGRRNQARFVAEDVLHWLDERPEDRPFFLYVHTIDPHVPYMPPPDDLTRYDAEPYEGVVDFRQNRTLLEGVKGGSIRLSARDRVRLEALYDGEITYHDRHFASVMESLARRGLDDETIVVFTADHGEEFWDHDSVGHGHSVWEELIRVPLIIRWPGVTDGAQRIDEAVGLVDVMPTILEALGEEVPDELSGRSVAQLLRGGREDAPRPTVTGFMNGWRTIVVGRYKLIQRTTSHIGLYDLGADPEETVDLAASRPIAVRYLRGLLGMTLAGAERPPAQREHEATRTTIDEATREQLEALGYAGASRAPTAEEAEE